MGKYVFTETRPCVLCVGLGLEVLSYGELRSTGGVPLEALFYRTVLNESYSGPDTN